MAGVVGVVGWNRACVGFAVGDIWLCEIIFQAIEFEDFEAGEAMAPEIEEFCVNSAVVGVQYGVARIQQCSTHTTFVIEGILVLHRNVDAHTDGWFPVVFCVLIIGI